jgi:hypothetical protein
VVAFLYQQKPNAFTPKEFTATCLPAGRQVKARKYDVRSTMYEEGRRQKS